MHAPKNALLTLLALVLSLSRPAAAQEAEAMREVTVKEILAGCKGLCRNTDVQGRPRTPGNGDFGG